MSVTVLNSSLDSFRLFKKTGPPCKVCAGVGAGALPPKVGPPRLDSA